MHKTKSILITKLKINKFSVSHIFKLRSVMVFKYTTRFCLGSITKVLVNFCNYDVII